MDKPEIKTNLNTEGVKKKLEPFIGKQVTVWFGRTVRNSFDTQLSISGDLEGADGNYRIVLSNGTYTYFTAKDVLIMGRKANAKFQDGSELVIRLVFETESVPEVDALKEKGLI